MGEFEDVMAAFERIERYLNGGNPGPVTEIRTGIYNSYANLAQQIGDIAEAVAKLGAPGPVDLDAVRQIVREELATLNLRFRKVTP